MCYCGEHSSDLYCDYWEKLLKRSDMKKTSFQLRLTHHEFADFYGELCDVIYRRDVGLAADGPLRHTSPLAREKAMEIVTRLADTGYLEYR